jgi:hypothetical protein
LSSYAQIAIGHVGRLVVDFLAGDERAREALPRDLGKKLHQIAGEVAPDLRMCGCSGCRVTWRAWTGSCCREWAAPAPRWGPGWPAVLQSLVADGDMLSLGICVGLQVLYEDSEEQDALCLGWLPGKVARSAATCGCRRSAGTRSARPGPVPGPDRRHSGEDQDTVAGRRR